MKKKVIGTVIVDDRLELLFRHAGLSEKQAKLYRLLLIDGEKRVATLSRSSGIKRGNTYALLRNLTLQGLVTEFDKNHITYFRPEPPQKLMELVEARQKEAGLAHDLATDLNPSLNRYYTLSIGKPTVRYFEGEQGLREVFADIYAPKTDVVYGCVDLEVVDSVFPQYVLRDLIPLRVKNKLFAYTLVADSQTARKIKAQDKLQLRQTILLDKKLYPLPAEIDVYEDKIAMLSFERRKFIGMIIQNQAFAETVRSIFRLCFAKQSPPKKIQAD